MMKERFFMRLMQGFTIGMVFLSVAGTAVAETHILATTFPIFQLVRHVVQGRAGVQVELMIPSQLGCPHDYTLTPQDMQKLAKADILVVNGLGLEEFLGAPVAKANNRIKIIDSSTGIGDTLQYSEEEEEGHDHSGLHREAEQAHGDHHHSGVNPHLFASPRMTVQLVRTIAAELAKVDAGGAAIYAKNADTYAKTMEKLAGDMAALGNRLKNNGIVQPHGVFDYLARDMGLTIVGTIRAHGQEPSAAEMLHLVKDIKEKQAGAVFIEPQYPQKVGKTLAKETGIPVATLDPVATGPEKAPLDYYETVMQQNMTTLEKTLGIK